MDQFTVMTSIDSRLIQLLGPLAIPNPLPKPGQVSQCAGVMGIKSCSIKPLCPVPIAGPLPLEGQNLQEERISSVSRLPTQLLGCILVPKPLIPPGNATHVAQ